MTRLVLPLATFALAAALLVGTSAEACEAHAGKKSESQASKAEPKSDTATPTASVAPSASEVIDAAMAGKCTCGGASDCTCKKGECECGKCGKAHKKTTPLYESLKGSSRVPGLENARYDASAGVFI